MINFPDKPTHTSQTGRGTISLDQDYEFEITKHSNGSVSYEVVVLGGVPQELKDVIEKTVLREAAKVGPFR